MRPKRKIGAYLRGSVPVQKPSPEALTGSAYAASAASACLCVHADRSGNGPQRRGQAVVYRKVPRFGRHGAPTALPKVKRQSLETKSLRRRTDGYRRRAVKVRGGIVR